MGRTNRLDALRRHAGVRLPRRAERSIFVEAGQLAANHRGVFRRAESIKLGGHPVQPARPQCRPLCKQALRFGSRSFGISLVKF